jgi:hypothetical protein
MAIFIFFWMMLYLWLISGRFELLLTYKDIFLDVSIALELSGLITTPLSHA